MIILPAIDIVDKKAVRLLRGEYDKMTVYDDDPVNTALDFIRKGADHIHIVDLEGAKDGTTPNYDVVTSIKKASNAFCEVGGGIRSLEVIEKYLQDGIDRVILGTAAVNDSELLKTAIAEFGEKIAVSVDLKDGAVAIKGWTEKSAVSADEFFAQMESAEVSTLICTDVSRDGAMQGTNLGLYRELNEKFKVRIIASGGVSSINDVRELKKIGLYGAIIGKAYYTGAIDLSQAVLEAK